MGDRRRKGPRRQRVAEEPREGAGGTRAGHGGAGSGSGAPISAMNVIRKHLSKIKGGRLAAAAYPAKVV